MEPLLLQSFLPRAGGTTRRVSSLQRPPCCEVHAGPVRGVPKGQFPSEALGPQPRKAQQPRQMLYFLEGLRSFLAMWMV